MTLSPADLSLFIGQEVQTLSDGTGTIISLDEDGVLVEFKEDSAPETAIDNMEHYHFSKIKPICRRMEDMTDEENEEFAEFMGDALDKYGSINHMQYGWDGIKYITSKGICPFQSWIDEELVIIKELNKKRHFGFDPISKPTK